MVLYEELSNITDLA